MSAARSYPLDDRAVLAARAGALSCLSLLALVAVPYLLTDAAAVRTYYGVAPVGPPVLALFAGVDLVAFLAGGAGRSDPQTVAGVVVVLGLVLTGFAAWWAALAVPVAGGLAALPSAFGYHPYALAALALAALVCAAGFARVVLPSAAT